MTASSPTRPTSHPKNVFRLHGVNVLNRKNIDSIARLTAIERRRTTHILDERQRRDTMNQLLNELACLIQESGGEAAAMDQQASLEPGQDLSNPGTPDNTNAPTSDGGRKRPPVKSNSITTLRNAIAEIHRLRSQASLVASQPSDLRTKSSSSMDTSSPLSSVPLGCSVTEGQSVYSSGESDDNGTENMMDFTIPDTRSLPSSFESSPEASPRMTSPAQHFFASDFLGSAQGQPVNQSLGLGMTLPSPDTQSQGSFQSPPSSPPTLHGFTVGATPPPSLSPILNTKNHVQTTTLPPLFSVLPPATFSALSQTQQGHHPLPTIQTFLPPPSPSSSSSSSSVRTAPHVLTPNSATPTAEPSSLTFRSVAGPSDQPEV